MHTRLANALVLAALVAFAAGCPAKAPTTPADEEKTSRTAKGKSPAPTASKAAGTASVKPSTPASTAVKASPSASPSAIASTAAATSNAPSTAASMAASVAPSAAPSATASAEDAPTAVQVLIIGMEFQPGRVTVKKGGTITFLNRDTASHTVKPDGHTTFTESPTLAPPADGAKDGGVFNATFPAEGEFKYVCGFHSSMTGTVVVVP